MPYECTKDFGEFVTQEEYLSHVALHYGASGGQVHDLSSSTLSRPSRKELLALHGGKAEPALGYMKEVKLLTHDKSSERKTIEKVEWMYFITQMLG